MAHWPQYFVLGALVLQYLLHRALKGEPRPNFDPDVFLFGAAIEIFVLYQGGFFSSLGWGP